MKRDTLALLESEIDSATLRRELEKLSNEITFDGLTHVWGPLDKLPPPEHAHGFVKGRSVRTGAEPHLGKAVVVRCDIADFFHSVTFARVRGWLIALGYGYPVATTLAVCS